MSNLQPPVKVLEAPISHEQEPHCCGCWIIWRTDTELYAKCNECGEQRDLLGFLSATRNPEQHAVSENMYLAGMRFLTGKGTAWSVTDLYIAMDAERVREETP